MMYFSTSGHSSRNRWCSSSRAEPHHIFNAGAVVPTAVENHDFAGRRKMLHIALHIHLGFLPVGGRRQCHHPEHTRADAPGERLDGAALPGSVASLESDDDAGARCLHPLLQSAKLNLELASSFS